MTSPSTSSKANDGLSLVITQPMLMPWHGMFAQLLLANRTLIYDDVQLPRGGGASRGFQTRVQIKTEKGTEWLSIPIQRSGHGPQRICDARLVGRDWKRDHLSRISNAYRRAPLFDRCYSELIEPIYQLESNMLADFLVGSMEAIARELGIATPFERTSHGKWADELSSTTRVLEICRQSKATKYLSGHGGMNYLDHEQFDAAGVSVHYCEYRLREYRQLHGEFTPYVSTIDLLFHVPPAEAREYLESRPIYWRDWPNQREGRPYRAAH